MWRHVVPLLQAKYEVFTPTALGHHGGKPATKRPARIEHVVDDIAAQIDELGHDRVHLAGNSMGGWVALELARRGRALSVCALSPGGMWTPNDENHRQVRRDLNGVTAQTVAARPVLPLLTRSARFRRWALRHTAQHGDRVGREEFLELADDVIGCTVLHELLNTDESCGFFESLPCPITVAWSAHDRILPLRTHGAFSRKVLPDAEFKVLADVGHVPMFDDPRLVSETILAATGV
jgi:pimeloyl-ACP methyl ester carboxylesterase